MLMKKNLFAEKWIPRVLATIILLAAWGEGFAEGSGGYRAVTGPCGLEFPRDHGPHPDYRIEWWYYTGNLRTEAGRPFGFQLTFFRSRMVPPGAEKDWPRPPSAWRTAQWMIGHAALSDVEGERFFQAEDIARAAAGLAGARMEDEVVRVFLKNWSMELGPSAHRLRAAADDFSLDLTLAPVKPLVLHGEEGYDSKGSTPERASCYYSFTRLRARGTVGVRGETLPVEGLAWMDHEFSSGPLEEGVAGWDWLGLQLDDGTELMAYVLRQRNGGAAPASGGTFVEASGETVALGRDDFRMEAVDHWESPETGARYPSRWKVEVPSLGLSLRVVPALAAQEMRTEATTRVTYWEGSVSVRGTARGGAVEGRGYVELTGYAGTESPLSGY